jgi:hypothetical protein
MQRFRRRPDGGAECARPPTKGLEMKLRLGIAIAALCMVAVLPATEAAAKPPPRGKYECTIGGMLFGSLTIKSGAAYTRNGKKGKYSAPGGKRTFPDGVKGWKIKFKTGSLKGFDGRWYKASDGTPQGNYEIALKNPLDDFESIYCDRRK